LFEQGWLISERESERESARLIAGFSGSGKMKRERERALGVGRQLNLNGINGLPHPFWE